MLSYSDPRITLLVTTPARAGNKNHRGLARDGFEECRMQSAKCGVGERASLAFEFGPPILRIGLGLELRAWSFRSHLTDPLPVLPNRLQRSEVARVKDIPGGCQHFPPFEIVPGIAGAD